MVARLLAHKRASVFLWAAALAAASFAIAAPLDIHTLIQQSVAANTRDMKAQDDYAFNERDIKSKIDSNGHVKPQGSKTTQVLMIEGSPYRRLLAVNGRPLSSARKAEEQSKLNHGDRPPAKRIRPR